MNASWVRGWWRLSVMLLSAFFACAIHAQVLDNQGPIVQTEQKLDTGEPIEAQAGLQFGYAIRAAGSLAVIGAPGADGHGAVYVFAKSSTGAWQVRTKILPPEMVPGRFGAKLAFDGTSLLVADEQTHKVYYFVLSANRWLYKARLSGGVAGFGTDMLMQGCTALISSSGAADRNQAPTERGYVHVYDRCVAGGNPWKWLGSITPTNVTAQDRYGDAIAWSGDHLLVGAPLMNGGLGAVYYYQRSGTSWVQRQRFVQSGVRTLPHFGKSVALDSSFALIGSDDLKDTNTEEPPQGFVHTFRRSGSTWIGVQQLQPTGTSQETYIAGFGAHAIVQPSRVIISAPAAFSYFQRTPGTVFIYNRSGTTLTLAERISKAGGDFSGYGEDLFATDSALFIGEWAEGHTGCCLYQRDGVTYAFRLPP